MHRSQVSLRTNFFARPARLPWLILLGLVCALPAGLGAQASAQGEAAAPASGSDEVRRLSGEEVYELVQERARAEGSHAGLLAALKQRGKNLPWEGAEQVDFEGNLRKVKGDGGEILLLRTLAGEVYVLAEVDPALADVEELLKNKHVYTVQIRRQVLDGVEFAFANLAAPPYRKLIDKLFRVFIILMLFFVMVGMGMTLRVKDFAMVVIKPRGMLVGPLLQFGLLPALAVGLGILAGYRESYPFIFIGLVLVTASPGGVTSNLMTYWGKGDLALSVSMTAISTILSLVMTPLLLVTYAAGVPEIEIPRGTIIAQIAVLVIVPLAIGMSLRHFRESWALKSEKFFSALGVFALVFLIITGILNNLDKFADLERYGLKFYAMIFTLTLSSMFLSVGLSKLLRVDNFQIRAITLETGLQNAALAMTIALLIQDEMGDFYSSMFAVSGLYGLWMYVAGGILILLFPKLLPVDLHFHVTDKR